MRPKPLQVGGRPALQLGKAGADSWSQPGAASLRTLGPKRLPTIVPHARPPVMGRSSLHAAERHQRQGKKRSSQDAQSPELVGGLCADGQRFGRHSIYPTTAQGVTGPSSFAFDSLGGGPYVSGQDGRILKYEGATACFVEFAFDAPTRSSAVCDGQSNYDDLGSTCGRPLGLDFNPLTQQFYVADAYVGLMVVGPKGGLATKLAGGVNGAPFRFLYGVGLDPLTGDVYFTEFSNVYQLRDITVALISGDGTFVLVGELIGNRIKRFWIKGPKCNTTETFVEFPGGRVNRIRRTILGDFWVAVNVDLNSTTTVSLPNRIKINSSGDVLETVVLDKEYNTTRISEVQERLGKYYIGSRYVNVNFVGVYDTI
ncbi:protein STRICTOSIDINE SYNTHASE-LIKE 11-like [Corylus avellana]|uniref:protein STRICTOSIDINE SYNTHASE-LIKE 11-like n=1 Tax=Corylus avellana TaxID=13451 RepID=UPI00286C17FA|nr:protein STRICTOSIDINE SYNTHASE-LIKE 11-like [Corylus avellana]